LSNPIISTSLALVFLCSSAAWGQPKDNSDRPVSFEKEVAPIIAAKCGNCHVSNSKGDYSIASYDALMNSDSIVPKETLKNWIAQGAKFDGKDEKKPLIDPSKAQQGAGHGQRSRSGSGGSRLRAVEKNPQAVGDAGVAWYVTWETGLAEAKRTNRPIFFMSAATQCSGVSGVF